MATVTPACFSAHSDYFITSTIGQRVSLETLTTQMIEQSDNFAANVLIEHLGLNEINREADRLQLTLMRIHGLFVDTAKRLSPSAYTTAKECTTILRHIVRESRNSKSGEAQKAYIKLISMMTRQMDRRFIPMAARGVPVADKTGEIYGEINDAAIVNPMSARPLLLTVLASGNFNAYGADDLYDRNVRAVQLHVERFYRDALRANGGKSIPGLSA